MMLLNSILYSMPQDTGAANGLQGSHTVLLHQCQYGTVKNVQVAQ